MGRQNIVMVERETYDAMVSAFNRVKVERMRNAQIAEKLEKSLDGVEHEMDSLAGKLNEILNNVSNSAQAAKSVPEEYVTIRVNLVRTAETLEYNLMESGDKVRKILTQIKNLKAGLKPFKDYKA